MGFLPTTTYEDYDIDIQYIAFIFTGDLCQLEEHAKLTLCTTEISYLINPLRYLVLQDSMLLVIGPGIQSQSLYRT